MYKRKSWREKLETLQEPKVVSRPGGGSMLIPRPLDVDALIRTVKRGSLVTQSEIRRVLAGRFQADVTCPITTGIFVRIAAEAAEEDLRAGKKRVTPYWRVVRDDGGLIDKFPGGVEEQSRRLRAEGHAIDQSGKPRVRNFGKV